jgi:hypothetical protein
MSNEFKAVNEIGTGHELVRWKSRGVRGGGWPVGEVASSPLPDLFFLFFCSFSVTHPFILYTLRSPPFPHTHSNNKLSPGPHPTTHGPASKHPNTTPHHHITPGTSIRPRLYLLAVRYDHTVFLMEARGWSRRTC